MKTCSRCKEPKPLQDFSPDKRARDGRQSACRVCVAAWRRWKYHQTPPPDIKTPERIRCVKCQEEKSSEEFYWDGRQSTGRQRRCKVCHRADIRDRYRRDPAHYLWYSAKRRAREKGLPFDLEVSDITIPEVCPVLGIPITPVREGFVNRPTSPSLDRVFPKKGYVKGNVVVMSWRANSIKRDATLEELKKLVDWMTTFCSEHPPLE